MPPYRGFNSWDSYGAAVTEAELRENARFMAEHLLPYGYQYIVCDIQWYEPKARGNTYNRDASLSMDRWGRLIPAVNRFPSSAGSQGFLPLSRFIHSLGLKFGIHLMRGISRQAVEADTPIMGSPHTAAEIADRSSTCVWNSDMYGVDPTKAGSQAYYDSLIALYAQWEVDFLKVDDIAVREGQRDPYAARAEIEMIRRAIDSQPQVMALSLSPGPAPIAERAHLEANAQMFRISGDFWDRWDDLRAMFDHAALWQGARKAGVYPDCDMLPLGRLCVHEPYLGPKNRRSRFTKDEKQTMMGLWAITHSPLFIGGVLSSLDEQEMALLTNGEVLALNTRREAPYEVCRTDTIRIWRSGDHIALFNLSDEPHTITYEPERPFTSAIELFSAQRHETLTSIVPPHGCRLFRLT
jgi:alpha-galactosidase